MFPLLLILIHFFIIIIEELNTVKTDKTIQNYARYWLIIIAYCSY